LRNASLGYGGREVLSQINLEVPRGDYLGLVGPNGSGKTTILRAMLNLVQPLSGSVERLVSGLQLGYVPQTESLDNSWPLRVRDVVIMGLYGRIGLFRRPGRDEWDEAKRAMEAVGIGGLSGRPFGSLSGGQKQRTLIARALASRPDILCLDEPTSGMDLSGARAILSLIADLHVAGITVVFVTHQLNDVVNSARRIGLVTAGGLSIGTTSQMITPENLGRLYGIPVRVVEVDGRRLVLADRGEHRVIDEIPDR
jgi:ABC-type Mn2+/Zn2+ transport system ATPase subunit